jgi:hypothetical protein
MVGPGAVHTFVWIGKVHRSVLGSLYPVNIILSLNITLHLSLAKTTLHPVLHSRRIPINDAVVKDGTICPVKTVGKPGICMLHTCVNMTLFLLGKLIVSGRVAMHLFSTSTPSMMKIDVAPVLAIS